MHRADAQFSFDVALAGGGPAGAVASILLARQGFRVALVDGGGDGARQRRLEGAGARLVAVLRAQGLSLDGIGAPLERTADWGASQAAVNREHPVRRPQFDHALRHQAAAEGVDVIAATVRRVAPGAIQLADGRTLAARLVVEARGRRAPVAPGRLRGPATVAIGGFVPVSVEGSRIQAHPNGWSWTLADPRDPGRAWRQVSVDAQALRGAATRGQAARATIEAAWGAADPGRPERLGPPPERPIVRGAELRLAAPTLDPALLRIGDAAVAMDPLSGHGLFWAVASALHAVPMARALLDGDSDRAARFHAERVVGTFFHQAEVGRDLYRATGLTGPFWQARAAWPDTAAQAQAQAQAEPAPHWRRQVVVRAGRLADADVLVTARDPGGVAFVQGHEIAPLIARAGSGGEPLPDRATFAARLAAEIAPAEAGRIHDWLTERGLAALPPLATRSNAHQQDPTTQEVTR